MFLAIFDLSYSDLAPWFDTRQEQAVLKYDAYALMQTVEADAGRQGSRDLMHLVEP